MIASSSSVRSLSSPSMKQGFSGNPNPRTSSPFSRKYTNPEVLERSSMSIAKDILDTYIPGDALISVSPTFFSSAFLISDAVLLSSGFRYLSSLPENLRVLGASSPPSSTR